MEKSVVEIATFESVEGVASSEVVLAVQEADAFLEECNGFTERSLFHAVDGEKWVHLIKWESLEAAERAQEPFFTSPHTRRLLSVINPERTSVVLAEEALGSASLAIR